MSESDTFSTDVLRQMRQINSINLRNATPEIRDKAEKDMKELFTNYNNNRKDDTFNLAIIQAMKGFEDKNPGLKVIDNYDDYKEIFGDRTVDSTNPATVKLGKFPDWLSLAERPAKSLAFVVMRG